MSFLASKIDIFSRSLVMISIPEATDLTQRARNFQGKRGKGGRADRPAGAAGPLSQPRQMRGACGDCTMRRKAQLFLRRL